jgi:hypothetical protein
MAFELSNIRVISAALDAGQLLVKDYFSESSSVVAAHLGFSQAPLLA